MSSGSNTALLAAVFLSFLALAFRALTAWMRRAGIIEREQTIRAYQFRWKIIVAIAAVFWLLALVEATWLWVE